MATDDGDNQEPDDDDGGPDDEHLRTLIREDRSPSEQLRQM